MSQFGLVTGKIQEMEEISDVLECKKLRAVAKDLNVTSLNGIV